MAVRDVSELPGKTVWAAKPRRWRSAKGSGVTAMSDILSRLKALGVSKGMPEKPSEPRKASDQMAALQAVFATKTSLADSPADFSALCSEFCSESCPFPEGLS